MNDTHLDPPDYQEPPEWYMLLEDALQDPHIPVSIVAAVSKAMEDWCSQQGEYDPGPEPVMDTPTLTIEEIKGNLCYHDAENPNNNLDCYDEEDRPKPRENCYCDNCFCGRDKLARYILSNA